MREVNPAYRSAPAWRKSSAGHEICLLTEMVLPAMTGPPPRLHRFAFPNAADPRQIEHGQGTVELLSHGCCVLCFSRSLVFPQAFAELLHFPAGERVQIDVADPGDGVPPLQAAILPHH